jgi:CO/xanthine dehydrogenase Mo-binding subunit
MVSDDVEACRAGNPRHAVVVRLKTGVKHNGTLTAHQVDYTVNSGADVACKPSGLLGGSAQAAGPYRVPNCRIESAFVYTTNGPSLYWRGIISRMRGTAAAAKRSRASAPPGVRLHSVGGGSTVGGLQLGKSRLNLRLR